MDAANFTLEDFANWMKQQKPSAKNAYQEQDWDWESSARGFGVTYVVLGSMAIVVNATFLYTLLARKRNTFQHTFYIMILNFTLIDTLKGICSILFALKLLKTDMSSHGSLWTVRVDQYSGLLLRFSNLATILNLLMITLNEYIFICYPLRYSSLVTRGRVIMLVIGAWILASTITLANMVAGTMHKSIMIDMECSLIANSTSSCIKHFDSSVSSHVTYHLGIIVFCIACLAVTAFSYCKLLRVISTLVKADMRQQAEMEKMKNNNGTEKDHSMALRRHKYVVVIGTVIVVYSVYLMTYAIIQAIQLINMSGDFSASRRKDTVYVKYICYLFISLHSLLQPLCYLRMREFRTLLRRTICGKKARDTMMTEHFYLCSQKEKQQCDDRTVL